MARRFLILICLLAFWPVQVFADSPTKVTVKSCLMQTDLFPLWRKPGHEHYVLPGLNIEYFNAIAERAEFEIDWVRAPFQRCLLMLKNGEVDVLNVASYKREREVYGLYPKMAGVIDPNKRFKYDRYSAFIHYHGNISWDGQSFAGLGVNDIVAIEIGASIESRLQQLNVRIKHFSSIESAFLMLRKERISAIVTNVNNGLKYADDSIRELQPAVVEKPYYLMVSFQFYAEQPELVENIWQLSGDLQHTVMHDIVARYRGIKSWPISVAKPGSRTGEGHIGKPEQSLKMNNLN